ncbi:MAG: glycosyltransferase family A protein [Actinomycetota bacterium]
MTPERFDASVVVAVAARDYGVLRRQIVALQRQRTALHFEVLIGDNGGSLELAQLPSGLPVRIVAASGVGGASYARNRAAEQAAGNSLLFCDADDVVGPDWVEAHVAALRTRPFTAGSSLGVKSSDDRLERAEAGSWPEERFPSKLIRHEGVDVAPTNNMGIRRELFRDVGGFSSDYRRMQDVALSLAVRRRGVTPAPVPDATVMYVQYDRGPLAQRGIRRQIGIARVLLSDEFGYGPSPAGVLLRAHIRLARTLARGRADRIKGELAELGGCWHGVIGGNGTLRRVFRRTVTPGAHDRTPER